MANTPETSCPKKCQTGYLSKQRSIYPAERRYVSGKIRTQESLLHGKLLVCEACKCIYIKHWRGLLPVGYLKLMVLGWYSSLAIE